MKSYLVFALKVVAVVVVTKLVLSQAAKVNVPGAATIAGLL